MPPLVESFQPLPIKKVAVVGAGRHGTAIAAHLSNVGLRVGLFDTSTERAQEAIARAGQAKPPLFHTSAAADAIECGCLSDSLDWLVDVDWVCEAVPEDAAVKKALYAALDPILPAHAVFSSCTTTLELASLIEGRSASFQRRFFGAHFTPWPRSSKILEVTPTSHSEAARVGAFRLFAENRAGRRVVQTLDTPGFIAARVAIFAGLHAAHVAEKLQTDIELAERLTASAFGLRGLGAFAFMDAYGLDVVAEVAAGIAARTPDGPTAFRLPRSLASLLERGCLGDKVGRGFNRREGGEALVLELTTLAYRPRREASLPMPSMESGACLRALLAERDEVGEFLRNFLVPLLKYVDSIKQVVSHSLLDVDRALKWAYDMPVGPFELIDATGPDAIGVSGPSNYESGRYRSFSGTYVLPEPEPHFRRLETNQVIREVPGLVVRDLGDEVKAVCVATDDGVLTMEAVESFHRLLESGFLHRFVFVPASNPACGGYDVRFIIDRIQAHDLVGLGNAFARLQELGKRLSECRCVAALTGTNVGAGFEVAMQCPRVLAHPETCLGLTAFASGIVPAGGGTTALRARSQFGGTKAMADAAMLLITAYVSTSSDDALRKGLLRATDKTVYHPDRLIDEAKEATLTVQPAPEIQWQSPEGPLSGMIDRQAQQQKARLGLTAHDEMVAEKIRNIFARATSYEDGLVLERKALVELCGKALTIARLKHLLSTGRPLRN